MQATTQCFHCGESVPAGLRLSVRIAGKPCPMCCEGCKAAAEFIRDAGLADYYRFRDSPAPRPEAARSWPMYGLGVGAVGRLNVGPEVSQKFIDRGGVGRRPFGVEAVVSTIRTDPWTARFGGIES